MPTIRNPNRTNFEGVQPLSYLLTSPTLLRTAAPPEYSHVASKPRGLIRDLTPNRNYGPLPMLNNAAPRSTKLRRKDKVTCRLGKKVELHLMSR